MKNFPLDLHVVKSIVLIPCDFSKHQRRFNFPQYLRIYLPCHDLINLMMRGPACMHGTSNSSTLLAHYDHVDYLRSDYISQTIGPFQRKMSWRTRWLRSPIISAVWGGSSPASGSDERVGSTSQELCFAVLLYLCLMEPYWSLFGDILSKANTNRFKWISRTYGTYAIPPLPYISIHVSRTSVLLAYCCLFQ